MFNKNILCLLLFITVIMSIGSVSAADNNVTDDLGFSTELIDLTDVIEGNSSTNNNVSDNNYKINEYNSVFRVEGNNSDITINVNDGQLIIHPKNFENGLICEIYENLTCNLKKINDSCVIIHNYVYNCSLIFNKSSNSISINGSCALDFNKMLYPLYVLHEFWLFNPLLFY